MAREGHCNRAIWLPRAIVCFKSPWKLATVVLSPPCHLAAQHCQFHSHASVMWMGPPPKWCSCHYILCLRSWQQPQSGLCPKFLTITAQAHKHKHHTRKYIYICTNTMRDRYLNTESACIYIHRSLLMMGGSMMFVSAPKELALLLGPIQQPTAAGY